STFFAAAGAHPVLDASDLDSYLLNRGTRMDQAEGSDRAGAVGRIAPDSIPPASASYLFGAESESHPAPKVSARRRSKSMPAMKPSRSRVARTFSSALTGVQRTIAVAPPPNRRKLGLAFGGGFARAVAHIGVLKVLEEEKIPIDLVAGTSAGAILGAAYCAGLSTRELEAMAVASRLRDFARITLSRYGLYASDRMANFCERVLKIKSFEDLKIPLAVTATDVRTGDPVVFTRGPLVNPMRASCAYPGMFPPVEVDGRSLIDGMLAYSVPTTPLREMGADFVIGVYLSADRSGHPAPRHLLEVIGQCLSIAEDKMRHLWKKDADLVVEPDISGFSFDCFDRAKELIANGEKAARAALPQLRRLLGLPEPYVLSAQRISLVR
ncbi:MAG TPA: patatin-like phospholipase family protein, partial [Terriglobales bacterium]